MSGRIIGISGPTVTVDLPGLQAVRAGRRSGDAALMGEVVRLERGRAVVQAVRKHARPGSRRACRRHRHAS